MKLQDFNTLAEAQAYELITDKKQIGSGQARGFFVNNGIWTALRQIQSDMTNPLFALADAVIVTASDASSYFGLDTTTAEGLGNLIAAQTMVDAGIMTATQKDELLALALKTTYPYENRTEHEFQIAKGSVTLKPIAQTGGYAVIHTNIACENHNPRLIAKVINPRTNKTTYHRINNFYNVSEVSSYDCKVSSEYLGNELFVDDVYSVIV